MRNFQFHKIQQKKKATIIVGDYVKLYGEDDPIGYGGFHVEGLSEGDSLDDITLIRETNGIE